ncbi:unnamed protein product [Echinostoma caproni]|uniref:Branchpoint-bridging protein n=1 Tax=Echinostoma caproni TaxID=27848 RepID=A0A183A5X9_9TREM|nr:unnamed protein product [Echinostoma caproni]
MSKRILAISDGSDSYPNNHPSHKSRSPEPTPRKRKTRWSAASDSERTYIPGMPTQLPPNLTPQQEKIYIIKEGKLGRRDGLPMPGEDEPLHAFVSAPTAESVQKAVKKINEIIRQGIEVPESQNDLRRAQLRELALLNGTLREHEGLMKLRAMAEAQTIATNKIHCGICGGAGHLSQDCKANLSAMAYIDQLNNNPTERAKMDSEYSALMAELGVGAASQFLNSGMGYRVSSEFTNSDSGRGGGIRAPRPPRQPPPPGVAPTEEEEDETSNTTTINGSTSTVTAVSTAIANTSDPYGYKLPPPPITPMMPGVGGWPGAGMMVPSMTGYPATPGYPPSVPSTGGTGVYTVPTASTGAATHGGTSWPTTAPTHGWGDSGTLPPPPPMPYGAPGMVPPPYGPMASNYWGTTTMYPPAVPNPPPPPPPGV